jgi:hypothetical protein
LGRKEKEMKDLQNCKFLAITPPGAIVDNASWTTAEIDTKGFAYLLVLATFGAMDIAMAALKLQSSDTTGASFADVTGAVGGTDFTLPSATDDNKIVAFFVDLRGKKRFFDLVATGGDGTAGTYMSVLAILSEAQITPANITDRGLLAQVII